MYFWRDTVGDVELAFTDRFAGDGPAGERPGAGDELDLALAGGPTAQANVSTLLADFAPGARLADMDQVHGARVELARPDLGRPACDALVTDAAEVVLMVRIADCVPVLLADPERGVLGAAHAGRPGVVAGVVPAVVERMRAAGAEDLRVWIGPHVCGRCYEVPASLRHEVDQVVPGTAATTSWGTPALDIGEGVRRQLLEAGVDQDSIVEVEGCTRERAELYSYRRDGAAAGRLAGLVVRR